MSTVALAAMQEELNRLRAARENKESTVKYCEENARKTRLDLARINKDIQDLELAILLVAAHANHGAAA
jgi:uncharacterized protein YfcZ (UPF0381/DUF406 family)